MSNSQKIAELQGSVDVLRRLLDFDWTLRSSDRDMTFSNITALERSVMKLSSRIEKLEQQAPPVRDSVVEQAEDSINGMSAEPEIGSPIELTDQDIERRRNEIRTEWVVECMRALGERREPEVRDMLSNLSNLNFLAGGDICG